jgi:hypothetical protein
MRKERTVFTEFDYLVQKERYRDAIAFAERQRRASTEKPARSAQPTLQTRFARWWRELTQRANAGRVGIPKTGTA